MRLALAALALILPLHSARAEEAAAVEALTVEVENLASAWQVITTRHFVVFSVTNASPNRTFEKVWVDCSQLDKNGRALSVQAGLVENVRPGEKAFGKTGGLGSEEAKSASCRITSAE